MHAVGLHSALAIKRQRKRRDEQKRARDRRFSSQSTESGFTSPRNSIGSIDHTPRTRRFQRRRKASSETVGPQVVTSVGMLHIGVVFLVLGAFLLVSGLLPGDLATWSTVASGGWLNELVATGAFALGIGIFLILLNKVIAKREEDDLNDYVQRQLTRSKSGHRLVRDVETGGLTTKNHQRSIQEQRDDDARRREQGTPEESNDLAPVHSPKTLQSPPPAYTTTQQHMLMMNGDVGPPVISPHLEKILEEEVSEKGEEESRAMDSYNKEVMSNDSTTASLSPGSPSETQELLSESGRYFKMSKI